MNRLNLEISGKLTISTCIQVRARTELRTKYSKLWIASYKGKKPTTYHHHHQAAVGLRISRKCPCVFVNWHHRPASSSGQLHACRFQHLDSEMHNNSEIKYGSMGRSTSNISKNAIQINKVADMYGSYTLSLESRQGSKEMTKSQWMVKIEDSNITVTCIRILQGLYTCHLWDMTFTDHRVPASKSKLSMKTQHHLHHQYHSPKSYNFP